MYVYDDRLRMNAIKSLFYGLLLTCLSNAALAIPFGNSNGSGGTVYALGADLINQNDDNDFAQLHIPETRLPWHPDYLNSNNQNNLAKIIDRRRYYDVGEREWLYSDFYIFEAGYEKGRRIEVQVSFDNGQRSWHDAYLTALLYAKQLGFVPPDLRAPTHTITIHNNYNGLRGGNNNIIIFEQRGAEHIQAGSIEEALFHEATHNYFNDLMFKKTHPQYHLWKQAQQKDDDYISYYARNNDYEDVAESLIAYYAVKYKSHRIINHQTKILTAIPYRMYYFEKLNLNLTHDEIAVAPKKDYLVVNRANDNVIEVADDSKIVQAVPKSNYAQSLWQFDVIDGGRYGHDRYRIKTKQADRVTCLDIVNGGNDDQKAQIKDCGDFSGQNFSLNPVGYNQYTIMPLWQKYLLTDSSAYLSCLSLSTENTSRVELQQCDGSAQQIFTLENG